MCIRRPRYAARTDQPLPGRPPRSRPAPVPSGEIIQRLSSLPVKVRTVPTLTELAEGNIRVDEIRPIMIGELGRDPVAPKQHLLDRCIRDQVVMVTGAGGSIGSNSAVRSLRPTTLVLLERRNSPLPDPSRTPGRARGGGVGLVPILASAGDRDHLRHVYAVSGSRPSTTLPISTCPWSSTTSRRE